MINDERWKSLGETEPNKGHAEIPQEKDGLAWCGREKGGMVEYTCEFCAGTGYVEDGSNETCGACLEGVYYDFCCEYHIEQQLKEEREDGSSK
jgi:hypothetical protein